MVAMPTRRTDRPVSRERLIRDRVPPPVDLVARQDYERKLAEWLALPEDERAVQGFGDRWMRNDPSLSM